MSSTHLYKKKQHTESNVSGSSTVSKVLRNKELYLRGERETEDGKRNIAKNPDFERTLAKHILNNPVPMTDQQIMERANRYARASPNPQAILNRLTTQWLRKFKQRNRIESLGPARRASEPTIQEKLAITARLHSISPSSPSGQTSPQSVSPTGDNFHSRGDHDFPYRSYGSQSQTSLMDGATASFSSDLISPGGTLTYSPEGQPTGFPLDPEFEAEQKRNASYHAMEVDYAAPVNDAADSELMTPRRIKPGCKQESPTADGVASIPSATLKGTKAKAQARTKLQTLRAAPSPEDAQRAAAVLLKYLQNLGQSSQFDNEYSAIMQLNHKLHLQPNQFSHAEARGLARIVEGDPDLITAGHC